MAYLTSVWATLLMEMWKRKEAMLQQRWNVQTLHVDEEVRNEYEEQTHHRRLSRVTGDIEVYIPPKIQCYRLAITGLTITLLMSIILLASMSLIAYRVAVNYILLDGSDDPINRQPKIISSVAPLLASSTSAIFIFIFEKIIEKISVCLVNMENPRTQEEYDNSLIYKSFALSFVNNYSCTIYIAFFKGSLYTYPGDMEQFKTFGAARFDVCKPPNCIFDLAIQLFIVMVMKTIVAQLIDIFLPILKTQFKKYQHPMHKHMQQWQQDYFLVEMEKNQMIKEYIKLVINYGFVTFFVAVFPIAPIIALASTIVELRVDAVKVTKKYRRPIGRKVTGLGAYFYILQMMTYIGYITNAFVIAFASNFIPRTMYQWEVDSKLRGFSDTSLSEFLIADYRSNVSGLNESICFYMGKRFPPSHKDKYVLTADFWYNTSIRLLFVVGFLHLIFLLNGFLAYSIPDIPYSVRKQINHQKKKLNQFRMDALNEAYLRNVKEHKATNIDLDFVEFSGD